MAANPVAPVIAGVTLPGRIDIEETSLVLNGVALRRIALVKIYVAGLYLPERKQQPEAILAAVEPRSLVMHFLRDVEAKRLCEGWDSSLENNTPNPSAKLRQQFETLCGWMETAREGERLSFVYVPGRGTSVEINGKVKGPMAGKEFADALFRTWIGPHALPGEEFKQKLLGTLWSQSANSQPPGGQRSAANEPSIAQGKVALHDWSSSAGSTVSVKLPVSVCAAASAVPVATVVRVNRQVFPAAKSSSHVKVATPSWPTVPTPVATLVPHGLSTVKTISVPACDDPGGAQVKSRSGRGFPVVERGGGVLRAVGQLRVGSAPTATRLQPGVTQRRYCGSRPRTTRS